MIGLMGSGKPGNGHFLLLLGIINLLFLRIDVFGFILISPFAVDGIFCISMNC